MAPDFDADLLKTFIAAAELGSFTKAAQVVCRSQAAVSMQIKRLEHAIGTPLFVRDTRNLSLTHAGETLLEYARRIRSLQDEAWAAVARPEITGHVVLGAPDDYISSLLPPVLRRFSAMYPAVDISVICAQSTALAPMLEDNRIDLAFVTRDRSLRLNGDFIRREPVWWVGKPDEPRVWQARPLPVALYESGCMARANTVAALDRAALPYRAAYSSASMLGLLAVVDAGLAIAALARCSVPERLSVLGARHGLPEIEPLDIVVARGAKSNRPTCDYLAAQMQQDLSRPMQSEPASDTAVLG